MLVELEERPRPRPCRGRIKPDIIAHLVKLKGEPFYARHLIKCGYQDACDLHDLPCAIMDPNKEAAIEASLEGLVGKIAKCQGPDLPLPSES